MDYEGALKAVQALFNNRDYNMCEALNNMNSLQVEISGFIDYLKHDIEQSEQ